MTQTEATGDLAPRGWDRRKIAALLLAGSVFTAPALAGDRAELNILGYSADGAFFAFEEFGKRDGSGFPYSSIFILDLEKDEWTGGSPFRVMPEREDATLTAVRAEAREKADAQLKTLGTREPASILALIGDGVPDTTAKFLTVGQPGVTEPGEVLNEVQLQLSTFPADSPEPCTDYIGEKAKGFALSVSTSDLARDVHRDESLPQSRGCPLDYRFYAVVAPFGSTERLAHTVALVSVYAHGFEGPDRRFIAVPLQQ